MKLIKRHALSQAQLAYENALTMYTFYSEIGDIENASREYDRSQHLIDILDYLN